MVNAPRVDIRYEFPNERSEYNPDTLVNALERLEAVSSAEDTPEGYEEARKAMDSKNYGKVFAPTSEDAKRAFLETGALALRNHGRVNSGKLAKIIGDDATTSIALSSHLRTKTGNNRGYDGVVDAIDGMHNVIETIKSNDSKRIGEYYFKSLEGLSDAGKAYYSGESARERVLETDIAFFRRTAGLAVGRYGAAKFTEETAKRLPKLEKDVEAEAKKLQEDINKSVRDAETKAGHVLTSEERIPINKEYREREEELEKMKKDVKTISEIIDRLVGYSVAKIKEDAEKKK